MADNKTFRNDVLIEFGERPVEALHVGVETLKQFATLAKPLDEARR